MASGTRLDGQPQVDFREVIGPLISENCIHCHGPDEGTREAGLRLDTFEGATTPSESGYAAVVPGKPDESELFLRVSSDDESMVMPPMDHADRLTQEQIEALRSWIAEGANYVEHWAFVPPRKPDLTELANDETSNPIDLLVAATLQQHGLELAEPASPGTLCRRIYLDVIGLPPSVEQLQEFETEAAKSLTTAVENLVDRLMSSEHYGEKWARHWLDVARYADSNGFEKDLPREQWSYRDWVIESLNKDKPYDEFIVEQIAGDLIPNRTQDQLIASGFLRNGMVNEEGAIVPEQFRIEGMFDRMDCIGKSVLGLSLQCAQCHTHKFDPITHDEYFGLFAFINDTYEAQSWIYSDSQLEQVRSIEQKLQQLRQEIKESEPEWQEQLRQFVEQEQARQPVWSVLDCNEYVWEGGLNHPEKLDDKSLLILGHPTVTGSCFFVAESPLEQIRELRLEALCHGDLPFGGPGRSYRGTFAISEFELFHRQSEEQEWQAVELATALADFEEEPHDLEDYFHHPGLDKDKRRQVGPATWMVDGDAKTAWRSDRGPVIRHQESAIVVKLSEPLVLPAKSQIKIRLTMSHGGDGNGRDNLQLGRVRLSVADGQTESLIFQRASLAIEKNEEDRTSEDQSAIFDAWCRQMPGLEEATRKIEELKKSYPEATTSVLHVAKTSEADRRTTKLLDRGEWDQPTHEVRAGVPNLLHGMDTGTDASQDNTTGQPSRLDFAYWLVDTDSPLTARVQANRIWQAIFGLGIVESSEDFGTRTSPPTHQPLLDWLAVELMENGWSQKQLIKTILTSKVYQQSSRASEQELERDPNNELLARGPRFRADAELIRDIALSAAGLMHDEVGGPSFYPPVPQSVLDYNYVKPTYWDPPQDEERYRRSLYMFRKRSMPDPVLTTMDSPNSDTACARRVRSNTPLAALVSLNEPVFVEAARALAQRLIDEGGETDAERIDYAYRLCTGRHVTAEESELIQRALVEQRRRIAAGEIDPVAIAGMKPAGEEPEPAEGKKTEGDSAADPSIPDKTRNGDLNEGNASELAAWTLIARVILNLDETLCKN